MHHLKNTKHGKVKEKLTREGHKRGNTFIKDKTDEKILACTDIKVVYR